MNWFHWNCLDLHQLKDLTLSHTAYVKLQGNFTIIIIFFFFSSKKILYSCSGKELSHDSMFRLSFIFYVAVTHANIWRICLTTQGNSTQQQTERILWSSTAPLCQLGFQVYIMTADRFGLTKCLGLQCNIEPRRPFPSFLQNSGCWRDRPSQDTHASFTNFCSLVCTDGGKKWATNQSPHVIKTIKTWH